MEVLTPDARPPWSVRRMKNGPTHIVARDGFTIIATVNHDVDGNAEKLAATPDLLRAAKMVSGFAVSWEPLTPRDIAELNAAIVKAEGR